jgi:hypothetical protein
MSAIEDRTDTRATAMRRASVAHGEQAGTELPT